MAPPSTDPPAAPASPAAPTADSLRADCSRCAALCCVAPAFVASSDFAVDKKAGQPCPNLRVDHRCGIHADLRRRGFAGCAVFDCFGAGQHVTQVLFGGRDWRQAPELAGAMFAAFDAVRVLHELLWYLTEASRLAGARAVHAELAEAHAETRRWCVAPPETLATVGLDAHRGRVNAVLQRASALARAEVPGPRLDRRGAHLIGVDLRRTDLRGATCAVPACSGRTCGASTSPGPTCVRRGCRGQTWPGRCS